MPPDYHHYRPQGQEEPVTLSLSKGERIALLAFRFVIFGLCHPELVEGLPQGARCANQRLGAPGLRLSGAR
jgi:hypothetical protein